MCSDAIAAKCCFFVIVNMWLVFISRRCDYPHQLHSGVLYKRERLLHCHLPRGYHPGHPASAQHEESRERGQVCVFSLSQFQRHHSHCYTSAKESPLIILNLMKTSTQLSRFTALYLSPMKVILVFSAQSLCSKTNKNRSSPQRGVYQVETCTLAFLLFSSCNLHSRWL